MSPGSQAEALRHAMEAGCLSFPIDTPFVAWAKQRGSSGGHAYATVLRLYSPYQLFGLAALKDLVVELSSAYVPSRKQRIQIPSEIIDYYRGVGLDSLHTSLVLTVIEPYLSVSVLHTATLPRGTSWEQYRQFVKSLNPHALLEQLFLTSEQVASIAEKLLYTARSDDPLEDWHDLVKLIDPDRWKELKGQAFLSAEIRIGAEMLYRFYEQLVRDGKAEPSEPLPEYIFDIRQTRLNPADCDVDATLMKYGLSPHPSLVIALEGETELYFVPLVMARMASRQLRSLVRVVNIGGIAKNIDLLTTYVAMPALGRRLSGGAILTRPPTKLMVVYDSEGKARTPKQRADIRRTLLDKLASATRTAYGVTVSRSDLDTLVETRTWSDDGGAFEFVHFSDEELADGILAASRRAVNPDRGELIGKVNETRAARKNLKYAWKDFAGRLPNKSDIAKALWPTLERKLNGAIERQNLDTVRIARVVYDALRTAAEVRRSSVMIRTEDDPGEDLLLMN
ncbi:MAG TPA: hypothetical protein DEV93_03110 [Chloroflexi bacterium]|nr:hypothetical protein [Chloroflexota bacterium]